MDMAVNDQPATAWLPEFMSIMRIALAVAGMRGSGADEDFGKP
ncbi:hypothetical protein [Nocardia fluminea]